MTSMKMLKVLLLFIFVFVSACSNFDEESLFNRALENTEKGDYRAAILDLKTILSKKPDNATARLLLGKAYLNMEQAVEAESELQKAKKLGVNERVDLLIIKSLLLQRKHEDALAYFNNDKNQFTGEESYLMGEVLLAKGEPEQAKAYFIKANEMSGEGAYGYLGLAKIDLMKKSVDGFFSNINKHLEVETGSIDGLLLLGRYYFVSGDSVKAEGYYKKVLKIISEKGMTFRELNTLAEFISRKIKAGDLKGSAEYIKRMHKLSPKHPMSNYFMALSSFDVQEIDKAEEYLLNVLKINDKHPASLYLIGNIKYSKKEFEQAVVYLNSFVTQSPGHMGSVKLLASTYLKVSQPENAIELLSPYMKKNKNDVELLMLNGDAMLASGQYADAAKVFKRAIQNKPEQRGMRQALASAMMRSGAAHDAIDVIKKEISLFGDNFRTEALLVLAYARDNNISQAMLNVDELISKYPDSSKALLLKGDLLLGQGDGEAAKKLFESAVAKSPESIGAKVALAKAEYAGGNLLEARAQLENIIQSDEENIQSLMGLAEIAFKEGNAEQAVIWLKQSVKSNPTAIEPRIVLARYYVLTRNYDLAKEMLNELASLNRSIPETDLLKAEIAVNANEPEKALLYLSELMKKNTTLTKVYLIAADAHLKSRDIASAKRMLNKAIEIDEKYFPAYMTLFKLAILEKDELAASRIRKAIKKWNASIYLDNMLRGDIYSMKKEYASAGKYYLKASEDKETSEIIVKRAKVLNRLNKQPEAFVLLESWLKKSAKDVTARHMLAMGYQHSGETDKAAIHYETILEVTPDDASVLNNLAWLYFESGDKRALELAKKASELAPQNGSITDTFGWLKFKSGSKEEGLRLLEKAAVQAGNIPDVRYHLAYALNELGQQQRAKEELDKVLASNRDSSLIKEAKELYEKIK